MVTTKWTAGLSGIEDALYIRKKVFAEEQGIAEHGGRDQDDAGALQLVVYDGSVPVAAGRLMIHDGYCKIGRIAVLPDSRGKKFGDFLIRLLIRRAFELGGDTQYVDAESGVTPFYEKYGFAVCGEAFHAHGHVYIPMQRSGDIGGCC